MICIYFNVRGLSGGPKFHALKNIILNNREDVYSCQEFMNLGTKSCEIILRILKDWEVFAIDAVGISSGLVAAWNHVTCSFKPFRTCVGILLEERVLGVEKHLHLLNIYTPYKDRKFLLDLNEVSGVLSLENVVVVGDLNLTLHSFES